MSWFSGGSKAGSSSSPKDSSYQPPKREERRHCWEARDRYYACLDRNEIVDAVQEASAAKSKCGKETEAFEKDCATSWVEYFKQKRVADFKKAEKYKQLEEEGAIPPGQSQKSGWKPW